MDVLNFLHNPIKNLCSLQRGRQAKRATPAHKKARPDDSGAGCEVQGKLETLEELTVVGRFAVCADVQAFALFFFRHTQPHHHVHHFEANVGDHA